MTFLLFRRAFTVIELLVAVPVFALLASGMVYILAAHVTMQVRTNDEAAARARADRVYAILREPLAMCGYGMPRDKAAYRNAFRTGKAPATEILAKDFNTWPGPICVIPSAVGEEERQRGSCLIAYAIPSRATTTHAVVTSADRITIELSDNPALLELTKTAYGPTSPKNWALFGAMHPSPRPLWFAAPGGSKKIVLRRTTPASHDEIVTIHQNDELYYLRVAMAEAGLYGKGDWAFFTDHRDGSGRQPRVTGIVDARFEPAPSKRTLKMHLLVRGDHRHPERITRGTPDGWPEEYAGSIPDSARHYRLYAFEMTFGLRNF